MSVVPSELGFQEVFKKHFWTHPPEFAHSELGITPETFNAVDVVFSSGKLVAVVVHAVVPVAICEQGIIRLPAVGDDVGVFQHPAFDDGTDFTLGTVPQDTQVNVLATLVDAQNRNLVGSSRPLFPRTRRGAK